MGRKVGIFSGSFNPIHNGHIAIACYMLEKEDLDEIWFIASPQNPLKSHDALLDDATRAHMVQLAIGDNPKLRYCDIEMHLPRPSYTITTLEALTRQNPDVDFVLLIGSDNWAIFGTIKRMGKRGRHIVTTAVEHSAVLESCRWMERQGYEVTFLKPDGQGRIAAAQVEELVEAEQNLDIDALVEEAVAGIERVLLDF